MPLSPRTLRPASSGFNPRQISGLALWLDASDSSTLFQNSDGTVSATATSDPVGYWGDKSGNARHATQATGANRPTVSTTTLNGRRTLGFDGSDDRLDIAALDTTPVTVFSVVRHNSGTTTAARTPYAFSDGASYLHAQFIQSGASQMIGLTHNSSRSSFTADKIDVLGASFLLTSSQSSGGGGLVGRVNGSGLPFTVAVQDAGGANRVGCRFRNSANDQFWNGQIAELLVYQSDLTDAQIARVERYLASRWGITLAPQVSNADAQDWVSRVYANGGTVSASTASAVNTFCDAIAGVSGLRACFYRLNLFCGGTSGTAAGINSALVPLYRGQSLGGTQYGGAVDTNAGSSAAFTGSDYTESSGLLCNGVKFLMLGTMAQLKPSWGTHHFGLDIKDGFPDAVTRYQMGAYFNETRNASRGWYTLLGSGSSFKGFDSGSSSRYGISADANMKMVVRAGSTDMRLYEDGTQISTTQASPDTATVLPGGQFCVGAVSYQNVDGGGTPTTIVNGYAPAVGTLRGYSIGESMSDAQRLAFSSAWSAFRTAMGRT
jgi:hypothetical protein